MRSSLIRARHVVTRVRSWSEVEAIEDCAVFQRDGVIVEVGPNPILVAKAPAR